MAGMMPYSQWPKLNASLYDYGCPELVAPLWNLGIRTCHILANLNAEEFKDACDGVRNWAIARVGFSLPGYTCILRLLREEFKTHPPPRLPLLMMVLPATPTGATPTQPELLPPSAQGLAHPTALEHEHGRYRTSPRLVSIVQHLPGDVCLRVPSCGGVVIPFRTCTNEGRTCGTGQHGQGLSASTFKRPSHAHVRSGLRSTTG